MSSKKFRKLESKKRYQEGNQEYKNFDWRRSILAQALRISTESVSEVINKSVDNSGNNGQNAAISKSIIDLFVRQLQRRNRKITEPSQGRKFVKSKYQNNN